MKTAVIYVSGTGNTAALAKAIFEDLPPEAEAVLGGPGALPEDAELIFAGFWTDKGGCPAELADLLPQLHKKQVALFGTAGFGGSQEYFDTILDRVASALPEDCRRLEGFMCQGRMPLGVKKRYEAMQAQSPEDPKWQAMLDNFDRAASHPDGDDLRKAGEFGKRIYIQASRKG